jgi:DNA repair and recombination RAD54-like protein
LPLSLRRQDVIEDGTDEEDGSTTDVSSSIPPHEPLVLWTDDNNPANKVEVIPELACKLRPHQREGVTFLFQCTMGLRGFEGNGCILADDMGLGKTLMSITLMWTLLNQGYVKGESAVRKVIIACPTSLVGNWDNEIRKWVGDKCNIFPVKAEPKRIIKNFITFRGKGVLIISYETQRRYSKMFEPPKVALSTFQSCCDLLICDEAHKLKNAESGLSQSLNALSVRRRILLSGTPMQNELGEFYNMVNFCNPNVLGSPTEFRKRYERPILVSREPHASANEIERAGKLQKELSTIVNEFILKRGNILNAQHLPPKLVQFVCCKLSPIQETLYNSLLNSKEVRHIKEGKQTNTLNSIRQLINICSHPRMIVDNYKAKVEAKEAVEQELKDLANICIQNGVGTTNVHASSSKQSDAKYGASIPTRGQPSKLAASSGADTILQRVTDWVDPDQSGKLFVLFRMMQTLRVNKQGERIVIVSNYTQTLDLIEKLCR